MKREKLEKNHSLSFSLIKMKKRNYKEKATEEVERNRERYDFCEKREKRKEKQGYDNKDIYRSIRLYMT